MPNDYSPEIVQALRIANMVPGAGEIASNLVQDLWGNPSYIKERADCWKDIATDAKGEVVDKIEGEKKAISADHWEGKAKDAYTEWIAELGDQARRIQDSIWQIGLQLEGAKVAVDSIRSDLRKMAMWLIGVAGATAATVFVEKKAAIAIALAVWQFVEELNNYYTAGKEKFAALTTQLSDLRLLSKDLVSWESGTTPGPIPIPVRIPQYGPELPLKDVGDWRNWGDADPNSRK